MKKIFILILSIIFLSSTFSFELAFEKIGKNNAIYCFYAMGECNIKNAKVIRNGKSIIVKTSKKNARNVKKNLSNILGESVSFLGDMFEFSQIKNEFSPSFVENETLENNIVVFSGYSEKFKNNLKEISANGRKINFQIAFNNGVITIGTPVILGDY